MERNLSPQFDLRPNMKDKPNSQGTLFRVSTDARRPEARQPHGYSPERRLTVGAYVTPKVYGYNPDVADGMHQRAQLIFNLARSSAPLEHIRAPQEWHLAGEQGDPLIQQGNRGYFTAHGGTPRIVLSSGTESNATAIHELGHSTSHEEGNAHSLYDTPERRGVEEAYAENYAQQHTFSPGYKKRPAGPVVRDIGESVRRASDWASRESTPERGRAFREAFMGARTITEGPGAERYFDTLFLANHPQDNWVTRNQTVGQGSREDWTEPGNATVSNVGGKRVLNPIKIKPLPKHILEAKKKTQQ